VHELKDFKMKNYEGMDMNSACKFHQKSEIYLGVRTYVIIKYRKVFLFAFPTKQ
jgi:hypothetical protein